MRKFFALAPALVAFFVGKGALAHHDIDVAGYGGVAVSNNIATTIGGQDGRITFDPGPVWGAYLGYRIERDGFIYLSYSRQETTSHFVLNSTDASSASRGVGIDWLQFGGNVETTKGRWAPFLGFSLGASRLSVLSGGVDDSWNFAAVLDGGVKFEVLPFMHLRLIGRIPFTFVADTNEVLCPVGGGCEATLSGTPLIQPQILLGLGFNFDL